MSTEYAVRFQEMIAKMPETLTKKEVDEYCKNAKKEIKATINEGKKVKKTAVQKKRVKKVEVDDDGNEVEKVKKPLNAYQQFIRDNRQKVKDENPGAKGDEIFTMIASLWQKHKDDLNNNEDNENDENDDGDVKQMAITTTTTAAAVAAVAAVNSDDDDDIKRVEDDKKKVKKEKKGKKDKVADKTSD